MTAQIRTPDPELRRLREDLATAAKNLAEENRRAEEYRMAFEQVEEKRGELTLEVHRLRQADIARRRTIDRLEREAKQLRAEREEARLERDRWKAEAEKPRATPMESAFSEVE